jgi:site-specific DNA-cytosine methylase
MDGFASYGNASGPLMLTNPMAVSYRKSKRAQTDQDDESWVEADETNTLNRFDTGDTRATQLIAATLTRGGHPNSNAPGRRKEDDVNLVAETASTLQRAGGERGQRIDAEGAAGGHLIPFNAEFSNQAQPGGDQMHTLDKNPNAAIASEMSVRRLTPVECERLMGWPDNWTAPEGVKAPDGKRYAACGDGIVSWVAYWIGQRIRMIEEENR